MYKPIGLCLNDFDVSYNPHLDRYELIHIQGPLISQDHYDATILETSYGFATSKDLVHWQSCPNAFGISEESNVFDNSAVWTMHTVYTNDYNTRLMFYTGVSKEHYFQQKIGLAIYDFRSRQWVRHSSNPIVEADPQYYQVEGEMAWRDPCVVYDSNTKQYVMFIAAKDTHQDLSVNGCVGLATSQDLYNWTVHSPVLSPGIYEEVECPVYYYKAPYHYLFLSIGEEKRVTVWRSKSMLEGYEECGYLLDQNEYAPRVINHNGEDLLLHTRWVERDSPVGQKVVSRGYLDVPRRLLQNEDGTLYLEDYLQDRIAAE